MTTPRKKITPKAKTPATKVVISERQWQMVLSYLRSAIAAVVAVIATIDYQAIDLAKAFIAALIPPVLRWINPKDAAFGRGTSEEA